MRKLYCTENGEGLDLNAVFSLQKEVANELLWICNYFHCDFWEFMDAASVSSMNKAESYIKEHPDVEGAKLDDVFDY